MRQDGYIIMQGMGLIILHRVLWQRFSYVVAGSSIFFLSHRCFWSFWTPSSWIYIYHSLSDYCTRHTSLMLHRLTHLIRVSCRIDIWLYCPRFVFLDSRHGTFFWTLCLLAFRHGSSILNVTRRDQQHTGRSARCRSPPDTVGNSRNVALRSWGETTQYIKPSEVSML